MSNYQLSKYKVRLYADTNKTQGLRTGDIVRRQYFDGKNVIYTLMVVTDYGKETVYNEETQKNEERNFFIGGLLQGDIPQTGELLDFARITSLFDTDRSGALYLTASDDMAPYMDILDRLGMEKSLSWPTMLGVRGFEDSSCQYVLKGGLSATYTERLFDRSRILSITRSEASDGFEGLQQDFYEYVANPEIILISYWIKASRETGYNLRLGYAEGDEVDGEWNLKAGTEWTYVIRAAVIDHSGRHLRNVRINLGGITDQSVEIADFNAIRLSSVADFGSSPSSRIGRLDGVKDPVFGTLKGYGAYLQKVFATNSAHVSGTLTAGDEDGFGSTFYAGRIHRNAFINSLEFNGGTGIIPETFVTYSQVQERYVTVTGEVQNPTGIGVVYRVNNAARIVPQTPDWVQAHLGEEFTYSFWLYTKDACVLRFRINDNYAEDWTIHESEALRWHRVSKTFKIRGDILSLGIEKTDESEDFFICAPQLEKGDMATEYQATDYKLDYDGGYGAWMSRGGFGGTIQNPLLKLNYDGNGSIGTRIDSFELKQDGSGQLANHQIRWDRQGNVTFGDKVSLTWDNFDSDTKAVMKSSIRITGRDTIAVLTQPGLEEPIYMPETVTLVVEQTNLHSIPSQRKWYWLRDGVWEEIPGENGLTFVVDPRADYWRESASAMFKCVVTISEIEVYQDAFTVKKFQTEGYTVRIVSSKGDFFRNGAINTILTAEVYYMGQLLPEEFVFDSFEFEWHRYILSESGPLEQTDLGGVTGTKPNELVLDHVFDGTEKYICEIKPQEGFDYYSLPAPFISFNVVAGGNNYENPEICVHTICGPWVSGAKYYYEGYNADHKRYETNEVYHKGCQWMCKATGTQEEPSFFAKDWEFTLGSSDFRVEFAEPERIYSLRHFEASLTVRAWIGPINITDQIPDANIQWTRYSEDQDGTPREVSDNIWAARHGNSGRQLLLTRDDLDIHSGGVPRKIVFTATVQLNEEVSAVAQFKY